MTRLNHLAKNLVELNPENTKKSEEIIAFLLKYSDRDENPSQNDIDKVLSNLGVSENISIKDVSKEEVLNLIYFFINNYEKEPTNNSYTNFRNQIKAVNSKVTDVEIQKLYLEMQEKLKNI